MIRAKHAAAWSETLQKQEGAAGAPHYLARKTRKQPSWLLPKRDDEPSVPINRRLGRSDTSRDSAA